MTLRSDPAVPKGFDRQRACSRKSRRLSPRPAPRALGWMQNAVSSTHRLPSSVHPMSRTTAQPNTCAGAPYYRSLSLESRTSRGTR